MLDLRATATVTRTAVAAALILVPLPRVHAQEAITFARFSAQVEANHPEALQAGLVRAQARSAMQEAWGAFDPRFALSVGQKVYGNDPYYTYVDAAIKVPTPLGADVMLGFERAAGTRISADRRTPQPGLLSLGVSLPLGQRIITDERRTALSVARAQRQIGDAEQQGLLNTLLLTAANAYGNWYAAFQRATIADEGVRLATFRFDAVVLRVRNGESAPIDTLEASLEVQRRSVTFAEADNELRAARLIAEAFLWDARGAPVALPGGARPVLDGLERTPIDTLRLSAWIESASTRHPDIRKADAKLQAAHATRLLARQAMIPFAEATVASLGERDQFGALGSSDRWRENYKAGLEVSSSLLLLKERGTASRTAQQVDFARLDRDQIRRELAYRARIALNDVVLLERVLVTQRANVRAATQLRDAEQARFIGGESTLLVVNLRERLLLDESVKLATVEGKLPAARAALVVAIGDSALIP